MEFKPEQGGWVEKVESWRPGPVETDRHGTRVVSTGLRPTSKPVVRPSNYPPHVDNWRANAMYATSRNLAFGVASSDGGGVDYGSAPAGWSPISADGILSGGGGVSQAQPTFYVRAAEARKQRKAEEQAAMAAGIARGEVPMRGGWPVDKSFKRDSPRAHGMLGNHPSF